MAKFKPYKLLESQLDSLPIQEGQFILTTDTNKLYSDTAANTRILISPDAITDLSVNGTTITYTRLDGTTGTITTKDTTYSVASITKNGLMSASDKEKLDTIEKGAQANTITGVKGDSESLYRTGNVNITKTNIGLNNVENKSSATIRGELTNSNVTTALGYTPLNSSLKGANNGLAELDASGKVPASQLPSYVDDVLEYSAKANFPTTGETGKIYVDTSTNKTYRWGGSAYAEISPSIALGTTSSTAFRGDYGQVAYTHAVTNKGSKFDSGLYKIATNAEGHVTDATEVAKSDITALGIPAQDTTYNAATTSAAGLMSPADKTKLNSIAAGAQKNTITGVKGSAETSYRTGNVNITAANIGLGNVENKSSETIREELTKTNITTALGYTPPTIDTDTTYTFATGDSNGTIKVTPSSGSAQNVSVKGLGLLAYKSSLVASDVDAIASSLKGIANGVAELDENGLVPSSQLPSYVDDVLEYDTKSDFPSEGESGKIYIDISTNQTYRWSGSAYAVISETLALGETSSTAYRGDRGKVAYDHSQIIGNPHQTTKTDIGLENVDNTADADKTVKEAGKVSHFIKIQRNGSLLGQFNGSSEIITNIEVPTKTSELINDSDFITSGGSITGNAATATSATSAGTSTKAEQDIKGQKIDETYIKALAVSGTTITYTKGDNSTGTIKTQDTNTTYGVATQTSNGLMSSTDKTKLDGIESGAQINTITGVKGNSETSYRTGNINITKANIGLGNVENKSSATIRGELTASNITTGLGYTPLNSNLKGAANGLAELDSNGKVPSAQLPSYVDDVVEYAAKANFPATGETGKIYVDTSTNKTYRWSGSAYVEISPSLALGTTSSTAYRGDYGNIAYTHATDSNRLTTATASGLYKVASTAQGHIASLTAVTKADITGLGIPGSDTNTTYTFATGDSNGQIKVTPSGGTATNISVKGLAASAYKAVDTSIAAASTSTNLPTSNAVAAFVEGKGYKTTDNNTTYTLTQDSSNGHIITLTPSSGNAMSVTIPDNNTTYTAGTGISLSGTTFSNAGVRSIVTGSSNGTISVNTNGTTANVAVKGLGSLAYKSSLSASDVSAIPVSAKGVANGVATLNENGLIPSAQLPSYVDDVIEGYYYNNKFYKENGHTTEIAGESGKIYVDLSTNKTYRWSGSTYAVISDTLALGTTSSTAYRGDYGNTAYQHSQKTSGNPHKVTKSDVGLGNVDNTADANKTVKEAKKTTGTLTIQKNGTNVQTFNGSSNITANIAVPTKVSELSNDSGYLTTHQDITGKTNTSVLPNDNGEIKTKFRISNKGYTGSGSTVWYYPLCKFPSDNSGNYASAIISGRIGGWIDSNMSSINALCWNRGSTGIALLDIAGGASSMSNIWNICDIVIYTDANATTDTVYLKCAGYFTFDLDLELFQNSATILYSGHLTTEPTGTLNAKASTTTKRVEIINGEMYIAGHKALTANNYTNYTTSKANTIKSLSISGKVITITKGDNTTSTITTQDTTYSNATQSQAGLMSPEDKTKLDNISISSMPIGAGCDYYGQVAPEGFLFADGSAISRTEYSELFAIIGTLYGAGDGSTTFNLPDKRERVSVMMKEGSANGTDGATLDTLGAKGGEFKHKQTIDELAIHNHTQAAHNHGVSIVSASNTWGPNYSNGISHKEKTVNATPKINNTGGGQAMNIMQPYIVCNYIIRAK